MDSILAFLDNQQYAILIGTLVGITFKFFPAFKKVSNELIPLIVAISAWLTNVFSPEPAFASVLGDMFKGIGGIFVPVLDLAVCKFLHELIWRGAAKGMGLQKPE